MASLLISTQLGLQPRWVAGRLVTEHTVTEQAFLSAPTSPCLVLLPFCGSRVRLCRSPADHSAPLGRGLIALDGAVRGGGFLSLIGQIVPFRHESPDFAMALLWAPVPPAWLIFLGVLPFLKEPAAA
jgi:hypothetical protein